MKSYSWDLKGKGSKRVVSKPIDGLSILLGVSSNGFTYHQFLDGNCNEVAVMSFLISLSEKLDCHEDSCRSSSMLLRENLSTHKTHWMRVMIHNLEIPSLFTAPESYSVIPVELLLSAIKQLDYSSKETPALPSELAAKTLTLTNKAAADGKD